MKKYTIFSLTFIFGLFLMTNVIANDDHDKQKRPIAVNNLPEDVREAIQENYEGYRIQEAFIVTRNGDGAEGRVLLCAVHDCLTWWCKSTMGVCSRQPLA
jgi:hypothetical protein